VSPQNQIHRRTFSGSAPDEITRPD